MIIYAAYQIQLENTGVRTVLVRQGFSFLALLLPVLWLAYRRMWWEVSVYIAFYLVLAVWEPANAISWFLFLASCLFIGIEGNSLYESSLQRRGYRLENVIIARDLIEAESRFFGLQAQKAVTGNSE